MLCLVSGAAAPALACNASYFEKKIINWDAEEFGERVSFFVL